MNICLIAALLVFAGAIGDQCSYEPISALSSEGKYRVELSADRTKATFFVKVEERKYEPAGEVVLSKDIGGCGELLLTPDGQAFFYLRNQGREEEDGRRLVFCRRDEGKGRPLFRPLSLKDLGIDPASCSRSESHTWLGEMTVDQMTMDERKGEVRVGKVRLSTKDGSRVKE